VEEHEGMTTYVRSFHASRIVLVCLGVAGITLAVAILSMTVGAVTLSVTDVLDAFGGGKNGFIVTQYRAPRVVVAILAGSSLAVAGVFLQGALRNPLASPDVVGITKWAGLGAFLVSVLTPPSWAVWAIPIGVIVGSLSGCAALFAVGRLLAGGIAGFALAGVALGLFAQAVVQYVMVLFPSRADQSMVWLAGSVYGSTSTDVIALSCWVILCLPLVFVGTKHLDAGGFADETLISIGLSPMILRGGLIVLSVLLCAGSVASVGSIGFLGLLAPHAARLLVGSRPTGLVATSALLGALLLTSADLLGRIVALPNEIPAGIVAAIIGGSYLIFLLFREGSSR
jgi:iron complex transport system permease protein